MKARDILEEKWTQRYRERGLYDVINDFEKHGGSWAGGRFGTVFVHPRWSFVYKIFSDDKCYLRFVRWAMRNPHPALPRFLTRPKAVVPFYRRHRRESEVYIVKLERLNEWKPPAYLGMDIGRWLDMMVGMTADRLEEYRKRWPETYDRIRYALKQHPELQGLIDGYRIILGSPVECAPDIHAGNIMQRADKSLVFTDPFWHGENPYTQYRAWLESETDSWEEPTDDDYVLGGEKWKRPKPRKAKPPTNWGGNSDDDIPF